MRAELVDMADRRQNNSDIWRPYIVSGPACQLRTPHDLHGDTLCEVDASISSSLSLSRQHAAAVESPSRAHSGELEHPPR